MSRAVSCPQWSVGEPGREPAGGQRHVADLGSIAQGHRTQRGRNGGCRVFLAMRSRRSALPFVLLLAQTANGLDCREYDLIGPLRYHSSGCDPALGGKRHARQTGQ
jgi:hypothetical protein